MPSRSFFFLYPWRVRNRVTPSTLPVIRRRRFRNPDHCTNLLSRQVWIFVFVSLSLSLSQFYFLSLDLSCFCSLSISPAVPFTVFLSTMRVSACCFTEGEVLKNLLGYLPSSFQSVLPSCFFFCVNLLLFTYLPPRGFPLLLKVVCFTNQSPTCHSRALFLRLPHPPFLY